MRRETELTAVGIALLLPLAGLGLFLADPALDVHWEHHPTHFWLVLGGAALNAALAYATSAAAYRRNDARVFLVSLAFLSAAGFLALHALATPGVLLDGKNAGFAMATPIGLRRRLRLRRRVEPRPLPAARRGDHAPRAAAARHADRRDDRRGRRSRSPRCRRSTTRRAPERASGPLVLLAVVGLALYGVAVVRYLRLLRRRPSAMLAGMTAAFLLLAEAMIAVAFGRNWHATLVGVAPAHARRVRARHLGGAPASGTRSASATSTSTTPPTGTREISVLFADLEGFTRFSELHGPSEVSAMLNTYFERIIPPVVRRHGGDVDRIIGDAVMATFNRRGDQPDHALRAARAALALQEATAEVVRDHPDWPRFRVGVNTGLAAMVVLGTAGARTHTAIGDTVNLAARLEGQAPVGGVAIGPQTARSLPGARTEPLGAVQVKGKAEPVEAHRLLEVYRQPIGLDPVGPGVGQRGEDRLDPLAVRLELRRQDDHRAELLERHVDGEAGPVVGDLEQHAAGLAEVDRVEVVAVDDPRVRDARLGEELRPPRVLVDRRAPRDVVDRAAALAAGLGRRRVVRDEAAAALAAQLPRRPRPAAWRRAAARARPRCGRGRRSRHGRRRSRAARAPAGSRDARRRAARRRSRRSRSSCARPSGSAKRRRSAVALGLDAQRREPVGPEVHGPGAATRQTIVWTMPAPARPGIAFGYSKNVSSEPGRPFSSA